MPQQHHTQVKGRGHDAPGPFDIIQGLANFQVAQTVPEKELLPHLLPRLWVGLLVGVMIEARRLVPELLLDFPVHPFDGLREFVLGLVESAHVVHGVIGQQAGGLRQLALAGVDLAQDAGPFAVAQGDGMRGEQLFTRLQVPAGFMDQRQLGQHIQVVRLILEDPLQHIQAHIRKLSSSVLVAKVGHEGKQGIGQLEGRGRVGPSPARGPGPGPDRKCGSIGLPARCRSMATR